MGSFTIHALDPEIDTRLSREAKKKGQSKNQPVKHLLAQGLGLASDGQFAPDYSEFCGLWSSKEAEKFASTQKENSAIDLRDWEA